MTLSSVDGPIEINISFGRQAGQLTCGAVGLKAEFDDAQKRSGLQKRFYDCFNASALGWYESNTLFYLGKFSDVEKAIERFVDLHDIGVDLSEPTDAALHTDTHEGLRLVASLLSKRLAEIAVNSAFVVDIHSRIATSGPLVRNQDEPPYVHENSFFESFRYSVLSLPQGISLQIDPMVRVLERKGTMRENEVLVTYCERTGCPQYEECIKGLPRSVVLYQGDASGAKERCPEFQTMSEVYDPWTAEVRHVPKLSLFGGPENRTPYVRARTYSIKAPKDRRFQTQRFYEKLCENGRLELLIGDGKIVFSSPFTSIPMVNAPTKPYSAYARAGEVRLIFGPGLADVDPYVGLTKYGTYAYNKPDPAHPNPSIRVFAVYPEALELRVSSLLERLKNGLYYYPGFNPGMKPFGTQLDYLKEPVSLRTGQSYSDMVKARLDNLRLDHAAREGDVYLVVLPDNDDCYYGLKGFAVERGLRVQMVTEESLGRLPSSAYTLYCFALSICVKAGVIPWRIDPSYFNGADCYIGLAFSRKEFRNHRKFYVGVADVFGSFGEHLSFALHDGDVSSDIRGLHVDREFMGELVGKASRRYLDKMRNAPETVVIHKPGSFLPDEMAGVSDALLEWGASRALLVHVQHNSLFRAYNQLLDYYPVATTYFRIGPGNAVILPTGYLLSSNKYRGLGTPRPVQLNVKEIGASGVVDRNVSDDDIHFVLQNYLAFTRLRWSSLSPTIRDPITIYAPRVVAEWKREGMTGLDGLNLSDVL